MIGAPKSGVVSSLFLLVCYLYVIADFVYFVIKNTGGGSDGLFWWMVFSFIFVFLMFFVKAGEVVRRTKHWNEKLVFAITTILVTLFLPYSIGLGIYMYVN